MLAIIRPLLIPINDKNSQAKVSCLAEIQLWRLVNSGKKVDSSNQSLKRVELSVLELEKILTQFQILSPSPKQKQMKYK